jgi:stage II sporulation protein D
VLVALCVVALTGCNCGSSGSTTRSEIRVALMEGVPAVKIGGSEHVTIRMQPGGRTVYSGTPGASAVEIRHHSRGLLVRDTRYDADELEARIDGNTGLEVNGRPYRGRVTVLRNRDDLTVVNTLPIEQYVRSVVPGEMLASFPEEALEAQAIVVRSFAAYHVRLNATRPSDIPATRIVYKGMSVENPRTTKAVDATRGLVLSYGGQVMLPYFCTCCGGYTEYAENVWSSEHGVTPPVRCPYCKDTPKYNWQATFSGLELGRRLAPLGVGKVLSIRVVKRSRAGRRVTQLRVTGSEKSELVRINRFRLLVGPDELRSGLFDLKVEDGKFVFTGHGWGHGVGMCQWGAKVMGDKGKSYREILGFYFPGAKLKRMSW